MLPGLILFIRPAPGADRRNRQTHVAALVLLQCRPLSVQVVIGGLSVWLNVPLLILAAIIWMTVKRTIRLTTVRTIIILLSLLFLSLLIAFAGPCADGLAKAAITAPVMAVLVLVGCEAGYSATCADWLSLQRTAVACLSLAYAAFFLEMVRPAWFPAGEQYRRFGKYSGLFQEPSEAAFTLFPCIAVLLVAKNKKMRWLGLIAVLGMLIFSRSSTLIALLLSWVVYRAFSSRKIWAPASCLTTGFAAMVAVTSLVNYESWIAPTAGRVAGVLQPDETAGVSRLA